MTMARTLNPMSMTSGVLMVRVVVLVPWCILMFLRLPLVRTIRGPCQKMAFYNTEYRKVELSRGHPLTVRFGRYLQR